MQVKKNKGGGTRSVDMNRNAHYDVCLQKAQELFFPKQTSQFGRLTDMTDCHLANYNGEIHGGILQTGNWHEPPSPLFCYKKG